MKEKFSQLEDWYYIRFSDKIHFDYNLQNKLYIIYKPRK